MSPALAHICAELDVRVIPANVRRTPGATKCGEVLDCLLERCGEGHVVLLLRTLMESAGNRMALVEPIIRAVSNVMLARPDWPNKGLEWLEAFDAIDLCDLWEKSKLDKGAPRPRLGVEARLNDQLRMIFKETVQERLI
jgi:hypothetical protein